MIPQWIIEKKRDGEKLGKEEIASFISRYSQGEIPDYQASALAMAIYFRGMDEMETLHLTEAMMESGDSISWAGEDFPTADKHSTGGIGDKISLMLAPLAATQGVHVPMISGRGLGITGGTLDKLESIPGYNTHLEIGEFKNIVRKVGASIIGQTARLAPADKKLYALRDVTGTVPSLPLITASIMSKKLAEGAQSLVFDVKYGKAAFMKTEEAARELASSLVSVAKGAGRGASAILTPMDEPHGRAAGNALEVLEAVETLKNAGPADTRELTLSLATEMVVLARGGGDAASVRASLERALEDGSALALFERMVVAHGGDPSFIGNPSMLGKAQRTVDVLSPSGGTIQSVDACEIGKIVLELGGGRTRAEDAIDHNAGVDRMARRGDKVEKGSLLMRLHGRSDRPFERLSAMAASAVKIA